MQNSVEKIILANGFTVFLDDSKKNHNVYINLLTKYGGMDSNFKFNDKEYNTTCGMAHFLEHLLIERSKHGNLLKVFGDNFFSSNGSTYSNMTQFYVIAVKNYTYALETLLDAILNPIFNEKDIEKTKPAIIEEIRMREDEFGRLVLKNMLQNIFYDNDYSNNLGTIDEIKKLNYDSIKTCYDAFYNPNNMCLFITGNFNKKEAIKIINKVCKSKKNKGVLEKLIKKESLNIRSKNNTIPCKIKSDFIDIAFKINLKDYNCSKYEMYNYLLMFFNLNFSEKRNFSKKLIKDKIVISGFTSNLCNYQDTFILEVSAYVLDKDKFIKEIMNLFAKNYNKDQEIFELSMQLEKLRLACASSTAIYKGSELITSYIEGYEFYYETVKDLENLNYEDYIKLIDSIDFSHYVINIFIPE